MTRSKIAQKILDETPQEIKDKVNQYGKAVIADHKWRVYDKEDADDRFALGSKSGREAYKAALRREIEKRIPESPDTFDEYVIGTRAAMKTILELLDTVEP